MVAATLLGLLLAGTQYLDAPDAPGAAWRALATQLPYPLLWWLLAPAIDAGERGVSRRVAAWPARVLAHAALALVLSAVHSGITLAYRVAMGLVDPATLAAAGLVRVATSWLPVGALVYAAILGSWLALRYREEGRARALAATQLEAELAGAELLALRMRLNPHFLFNTMNTITMLVRARENERAVQMLAGFSDLLRTVLLRDGEDLVPLGDEVALAERYLAIEAVRFEDRLRVHVDVPPALRTAPVPSLLLQPLVENAIRHGVGRAPGPARVELVARADGDALEVTVRNASEATGEARRAEPGTGTGLATTRRRLARRYGERGTLALDVDARGATATVRVPLDGGAA